MPTLLMWGRFDAGYSRNRMVENYFSESGWDINIFRPLSSRTGSFEALFYGLKRPDIIWVPCFRHDDILSASRQAVKWGVPLIIDPLISSYEKEVFEKKKQAPDSCGGRRMLKREARLFSKADLIVADTPAHADFFSETFDIDPSKLAVLYVGAEDDMFKPTPAPDPKPPFELLFYGSFIHLQGVDVIVSAAQKSLAAGLDAKWTLLGDGNLKPDAKKMAKGASHIRFEPWMDYSLLPERMARAHILLGIFGTTPKAGFVIPNKVFQSMAAARPVITMRSSAYRDTLEGSDVIGWTTAGDPDSLTDMACQWLKEPSLLRERGEKTRALFDDFFSREKMERALLDIIHKVF